MANTPKNRKDLKSYFVKNSIPTQSNFEDLIDGMLNQQDDGIIKVPGDPLKIIANDNSQGLINFFEKIEDANPAWFLQLNPRTDAKDSSTAKAGFCIADGQGMPRLFIDKATGNIGIGTLNPIAPLDIAQVPRQAKDLPNHPKSIKGLYITGDLGVDSDGIEFRHTDGTQGIGFGYNTIYAAGSNTDQVLQLKPRGAGALRILGKANISDGSYLAPVEDKMASGSLTIGSITSNYGGGTTQWNSNTAGLLLQTQANTEIAVHDAYTRIASLMYYEGDAVNKITIGRDMGWGVTTPVNIAGNLVVSGSITNANDDNQWQNPVLLNGWTNYNSDTNTFNYAQYRIDGDGVVWFRGLVKGGATGTTIFTLPVGYRPTNRQLHGVCTSESVMGRVDVFRDGSVQVINGSSVWLSLDGIAFRARAPK